MKYGTVTRKRRDGDEISFTDFRGQRVTKLRAPVAVIWKDDDKGYLSIRFEKEVEAALAKGGLDVKEFFLDVFIEDRTSASGKPSGNAPRPAQELVGGRPRRGRTEEPAADDESDDDAPF